MFGVAAFLGKSVRTATGCIAHVRRAINVPELHQPLDGSCTLGRPSHSHRTISSTHTMQADGNSQPPQITFISGCSSGIGLATAVRMAKDRQRRFIVYGSVLGSPDDESVFREAAGSALNDTLYPVQMDVRKDDDVSAAVAMVMEKHGRLDILINNAGILIKMALETLKMEDIIRLYDINVFGCIRMLRQVLPIMKQQQSGRIIINSSRNSFEGSPYMNVYTSSKRALDGLAEESAVIGRFFNIWVSTIHAGGVKTPINDAMIAGNLGNLGSKGISDHPDVHEIDRKLSRYRDHDLAWSRCPPITAEEVAEVMLRAATDERPHFRYMTSEAVNDVAAQRFLDPTGDKCIEYQVEKLRPFFEADI